MGSCPIQEEPALFALPARSREAKDDKIFCVLFGRLHRCRRRRRRRRRRLQGDVRRTPRVERRIRRQRRIRRRARNNNNNNNERAYYYYSSRALYYLFIFHLFTAHYRTPPRQSRKGGWAHVHTHIKCKEKRRGLL